MSVFVEVDSVEKKCKVIINLDMVVEIAPLTSGGCVLYFADAQAVGGKTAMKVLDSYAAFQQFAMQTVSAQDVADRIASINKAAGGSGDTEKRGPGRPKTITVEDIPKL
jgi:hypothetical protein